MKQLLLLTGLVAMTGCAGFSTKQTDVSYEAGNTNKPTRAITTKVSAYTVFSARSELAKFRASQTDKTQSAAVGTLNQAADFNTNANMIVEAVVAAAIKAACGK